VSDTPDAIASLGSDRRSPPMPVHVVVVDAGMVGVLGARVLAAHCERHRRVYRGGTNQARQPRDLAWLPCR
jgi:hypothetical protein